MKDWKSIVVPGWAYREVELLRALIISANEAGTLPRDVREFIRSRQLQGTTVDPYARGTILGTVCLLARKALPHVDPEAARRTAAKRSAAARRAVRRTRAAAIVGGGT